jgi:hypothetical protein
MPNWCSNTLSLTHSDPDRIRRAVTAFESNKFLEHIVPLPNDTWDYDFCVSKWGTKWDVSGQVKDVGLHHAVFSFDSAWSPPCPAYERLIELGFDVKAFYNEPGMAFCGLWEGCMHKGWFDNHYEYSGETSKSVRATIGEELDDHWGISLQMESYEARHIEQIPRV